MKHYFEISHSSFAALYFSVLLLHIDCVVPRTATRKTNVIRYSVRSKSQ